MTQISQQTDRTAAPDRPTDPWRGCDEATRADAEAVAARLPATGRLGVAYSGGVDSATLLAVAVRALGPDRVVALMGVSPSLAADEADLARAIAAEAGARLVEFPTHEGDNPLYRANGADRCFHCKDELFTRIGDDVASAEGLTHVAYGENADDARRIDRPGSRAATEHEVLRPLADAGLTKGRVRALAHALGVRSADKPAAPCLASRIPHGQEVTPEKLQQVEAAERALRAVGIADSRVRHHGDIARIEVAPTDLATLIADGVRDEVVRAIKAAGFGYVTLDLVGLQSGAFTLQVLTRRG